MFMLLYNYGGKESAAIAQPLSSGIFAASALNNVGKMDYQLAMVLVPGMISGVVAGVHFKYLLFLICTL